MPIRGVRFDPKEFPASYVWYFSSASTGTRTTDLLTLKSVSDPISDFTGFLAQISPLIVRCSLYRDYSS